MSSVYRRRGRFEAAVVVAGERHRKTFSSHADARRWALDTEQAMRSRRNGEPLLGGPNAATLAVALEHYAHHYTIGKKGAKAELDRINRYLVAAGLVPLALAARDNGEGKELIGKPARHTPLPGAFAQHLHKRLDARAGTAALRAQLANLPCASIDRTHLRAYVAAMQGEGLSGSTIRKEIALLKHMWNMAAEEWAWQDFKNPASGMKLPRPAPARRVLLPREDAERLFQAIDDCDNPLMPWYLVLKLETSARRGSLLELTWSDIDLDARTIRLFDTKPGETELPPLTLRAVLALRHMPRTPGEPRIFPMSTNAVTCAWKRIRERAGRPDLREHDLRHIALTWLARRLRSAHLLQKISGHANAATLEIYVDLTADDVYAALDATEPPLPGDPADTVPAPAAALRHRASQPPAMPLPPLPATLLASAADGAIIDARAIAGHRKARRLNQRHANDNAGPDAAALPPAEAEAQARNSAALVAGSNVVQFELIRHRRRQARDGEASTGTSMQEQSR